MPPDAPKTVFRADGEVETVRSFGYTDFAWRV